MKCPQCDHEVSPDAACCPGCAAPVRLTCPECGFRAPAEFAFCPMCAAPLTTPEGGPGVSALDRAIKRLVPKEYAKRLVASGGQMAGERRMVTILMSDITGSSAMARGLDPEEVMEIMDGAFEVMIEPIARYEGTVARLEGGAIMAFFGAPIAHEDDAERACRAGLEIVEGAREYAEKLEAERGVTGFNVRVGIHTGLVVVGEVGTDLRVEYTAMGEAPNLTARLESGAEPGTVLVSKETHQTIAPLFETQALEPLEAKGWDQPVPVYRVLAAKELSGK
ncbi:MAG: adenylate/guanylate cyclase domain-containing protein, partial [Anaerolineae bacterium]